MKTLLLALFSALALYGQSQNNNLISIIPTTNPAGAQIAPGQVRFLDTQSYYAGLSAPNAGVTQLTIASATAANPMVLTVSTAPPATWAPGFVINISLAAGSGCSGMNGPQTISGVTGSTVTISFNGTGCTYTPSTGTILTSWIYQLPQGGGSGCWYDSGNQQLTLAPCAAGAGGAPGGPATAIQVNCPTAGTFCGYTGFTFNGATGTMTVDGLNGSIFTRDLGTTSVTTPQAAMFLGLSGTGTQVAGDGPSIVFQAWNTANAVENLARVNGVWINPTAGSETGALSFMVRVNSADTPAYTQVMEISNLLVTTPSDLYYAWKDTGGNTVYLLGLDTYDNFNIGAATSVATIGKGWINFWADGVKALELDNQGNFFPATDATSFLGTPSFRFGSVQSMGMYVYSSSLTQATISIASQNNNGKFVNLMAAASITSNYNMALPPNGGTANYLLQTDGTGVTTWTPPPNCYTDCMTTDTNQTVTATKTWDADQWFYNNKYLKWNDSSSAQINILALDSVDNLSIGAQSTVATSAHGWINFYANGTKYLELTNAGNLLPVTDGASDLGGAGNNFGQVNTYAVTVPSLGGAIGTIGIESQNANGHYVDIRAAANVASTYILALPPNPGTNSYFLETDGTGITSWAPVGACATCLVTTGGQTVTGTDTWNADQYFGNNRYLKWFDSGSNLINILALDSVDNVSIGAQSVVNTSGHGWINFYADGTKVLELTNTGNLLPITDGAYDLGGVGNNFGQVNTYAVTVPSNGALYGTIGIESQNSNGHYVDIRAAANVAGTYILALPPNGGTNGYFLQTDGTGITSWAAAGSCPTCLLTGGGQTVTGTDLFSVSQHFSNNVTLGWLDTGSSVIASLFLDASDNFNVGALSAVHTSGHGWINFWADGDEYFYLTNLGELKPVNDGAAGGGLSLGDPTHNLLAAYVYQMTMPTSGSLPGTVSIESQNANGNYVDIRAAANVAGTYILALPPNGGTNGYFLQTNGSGTTIWAPLTGGTGTVTSVATSGPITGGTFTTSGTISCPTCLTTAGGQSISGSDVFSGTILGAASPSTFANSNGLFAVGSNGFTTAVNFDASASGTNIAFQNLFSSFTVNGNGALVASSVTTSGNVQVSGSVVSTIYDISGGFFGQDRTSGLSLALAGGGTCTLFFKGGILYSASGC